MASVKNKRIARFMFELREVGLEANRFMSERIEGRGEGEDDQFLIACLVTSDEILHKDLSVLEEFSEYINDLPRRVNVKDRYLREGRVVCLLNIGEGTNYHVHGEARLLDPDGQIRDGLGIWRPDGFDEPRNYLEEMEENFTEEYGEFADAHLLIFSHYLPCTMEGHECARLIGEFDQNWTNHRVTVAYKDDYCKTRRREALTDMEENEVNVLQPWYMRQIADNNGQAWMWDRE